MALHIADLYSISVTILSSVHPETSTLQDSYTVSSLDASRFPSVICSWSSTRWWRKVLTDGRCLYASATSVRLPSGSDCFAHAWWQAPEPFPLPPSPLIHIAHYQYDTEVWITSLVRGLTLGLTAFPLPSHRLTCLIFLSLPVCPGCCWHRVLEVIQVVMSLDSYKPTFVNNNMRRRTISS